MSDKLKGFLEVGISEAGDEIIVNNPDLEPDENGVGHIVFSFNQARQFAYLLLRKVGDAEVAIGAANSFGTIVPLAYLRETARLANWDCQGRQQMRVMITEEMVKRMSDRIEAGQTGDIVILTKLIETRQSFWLSFGPSIQREFDKQASRA